MAVFNMSYGINQHIMTEKSAFVDCVCTFSLSRYGPLVIITFFVVHTVLDLVIEGILHPFYDVLVSFLIITIFPHCSNVCFSVT